MSMSKKAGIIDSLDDIAGHLNNVGDVERLVQDLSNPQELSKAGRLDAAITAGALIGNGLSYLSILTNAGPVPIGAGITAFNIQLNVAVMAATPFAIKQNLSEGNYVGAFSNALGGVSAMQNALSSVASLIPGLNPLEVGVARGSSRLNLLNLGINVIIDEGTERVINDKIQEFLDGDMFSDSLDTAIRMHGKDAVAGTFDKVSNTMDVARQKIADTYKQAEQAVKDGVKDAKQAMAEAAEKAQDIAKQMGQDIQEAFKEVSEDIADAFRGFRDMIDEQFKEWSERAEEYFKDFEMPEWFPDFPDFPVDLPDWLPDSFAQWFDIPNRTGQHYFYDPLVLDLDGDGTELAA